LGNVYWTWTVFHSSLHLLSEPFITLVNIQQLLLACRKGCRPLSRAIFTTVLSKWQSQLDEICETLQYQPPLVKQLSNGTFKVITSNTADNSNPVGCYTVLLGTTFVLHFFVIAILQIALNSNDQSFCTYVCMYVCMYETTLDHRKLKTQVSWDVLLCSLVNSYWSFKGTKLSFTCFGIFHSLKILYLQWEFTG